MTNLTPLYNSHSIVLLYLLSAPPFYIPSQHSFFTTSLPPFYPLYVSTPYSLSILPSILLSTVPLYNPFLQLVVPLVTRQPLHMTKSHLMLHLHSPSLSPLYSSPFYIPFSSSPFYTSSLHPFSTSFSTPLLYSIFTPYLHLPTSCLTPL